MNVSPYDQDTKMTFLFNAITGGIVKNYKIDTVFLSSFWPFPLSAKSDEENNFSLYNFLSGNINKLRDGFGISKLDIIWNLERNTDISWWTKENAVIKVSNKWIVESKIPIEIISWCLLVFLPSKFGNNRFCWYGLGAFSQSHLISLWSWRYDREGDTTLFSFSYPYLFELIFYVLMVS